MRVLSLLTLSTLILLLGCSSSKYDIQVTCDIKSGAVFSRDVPSGLREDPVQTIACNFGKGDTFLIACDRKTVQHLNGDYLCSTLDKKSVYVKIIPMMD